MAVTRTLYATIEIACCRDDDEVYHPLPRQVVAPQTKPYFTESLSDWEERARTAVEEKYRAMAEDECSGMGTPRLCLFEMYNVRSEETGEPELPIPTSTCNLYRELIRDNARQRRAVESAESEIEAIFRETPREDLTPAQIREIRSLNDEIRDARTIIRENDSELRDLESRFEGIEDECR